jgi:D-lactate dehydrogenase (cytochrome)
MAEHPKFNVSGRPTMVAASRKPTFGAGFAAAHAELAALFGDRLSVSQAIRDQHCNTTTWVAGTPPDAVAFPRSANEAQQAVLICGRHGVPIIAFGAGTSFEGHVNAPFGGLCVDFREMNRVIEVHAADFDCVVEPGVTRKQLNGMLRDQGLFFPVDPGADASLGGMASTRASGTTAVRYGTMKDNVLAMKIVLPGGDHVTTSRRAPKSSAGYDLTRLFVGAEGTLGIITELTLRLYGIPEAVAAAVCQFPSIEACCEAAITAIQSGIPMARVELLDEMQVRVCNAYSRLNLPEQPHLFLEFHGSKASVAEQVERFGAIANECGGGSFEWAAQAEDRARIWQTRHDVFWALRSYRAGAKVVVSDVCVPISQLARCVLETRRDIDRLNLIAPIVGHVGDGNFHASVLVMMSDPDEVARSESLLERIVERSLAMDGTCTGEHGIGEGKKHFMVAEHGQGAVNLMAAIKHAIDPSNIMNPGKIV